MTPPRGSDIQDCECSIIEAQASRHLPIGVVMVVLVYKSVLPKVRKARVEPTLFFDSYFATLLCM